jgi:outer membrane protein, heavy metal efflux system
MRLVALSLLFCTAACAGYAPEPLAIDRSALAAPVASILEERASRIERPWLAPVAVDLDAPLTMDALSAIAVVNNPDLVAQRSRAGVADAQVFAAGLLPDPTFSIGANKVLSGPDTMLDIAGGLGLDLNALRTRAVRRELAVAQDRQVRLDLAWAEWQTAGQARLQAVRILRLERIAAHASQSRQSARDLLDRILRAAGRGDLAGDRIQTASTALQAAEDTLSTTSKDLTAARSELRRQLGLPPHFAMELAPLPVEANPLPSSEALFAIAETNRTDLSALREGYAAQEATVHQAVLDQFPNLNLTLNTARDSAGNLLLGPAIDFTLPLWNRNRGTIRTERATREALRTEYDARLFQTRADITAAKAGISLARNRRTRALEGVSQVETLAASSDRAARRGDLSWETAQTAAQALRDRQIQIEQAEQDLAEQMIALELLTGTPRGAWPK